MIQEIQAPSTHLAHKAMLELRPDIGPEPAFTDHVDQVLRPEGYRLVAIEAYRDGTGPGVAGCRSLDDYADQVYAVTAHVSVSVHLVGFSWGGSIAVVALAALTLHLFVKPLDVVWLSLLRRFGV